MAGVVDGVGSGYRVIEDYLREGQALARGLIGGSPDAGPTGPRFQEVTEQLLRAGLLWWTQLAGLLAGLNLPGAARPGPVSAESGAPTPAPGGLAVEVEASGRTSLQLDLTPAAMGAAFGVHPLHAPGGPGPALEDVRVDWSPTGPRLRMRVPEGQPPGIYSGVLFRLDSGEPCGTVTARLGPDAE